MPGSLVRPFRILQFTEGRQDSVSSLKLSLAIESRAKDQEFHRSSPRKVTNCNWVQRIIFPNFVWEIQQVMNIACLKLINESKCKEKSKWKHKCSRGILADTIKTFLGQFLQPPSYNIWHITWPPYSAHPQTLFCTFGPIYLVHIWLRTTNWQENC